jgi:hypothetical protein
MFNNILSKEEVEKRFPKGSSVEILGTDRLGIVVSEAKVYHPLKQCGYPKCDCKTISELDKEKQSIMVPYDIMNL